ncbi:MAG: right-handed parallel beta-helix repeat-containing protein [Desulfobacterales bacterium]|nr:right-handed parallel beta-helix repeat-containing protein [Desulfobacterales bacterium]
MGRNQNLRQRPYGLLILLVLALLLNGCTLRKAMNMRTYEDFAEISNSFWTNLYFYFKAVTIPGYESVIYKDTLWRQKDSPIVVDRNTYILPGVTLTIEPGVKILLGENKRITCRGLVKALGAESAPILFTWKDEGRYWDLLEFLTATGGDRTDPGKIEIKHTILEYGRGFKANLSQVQVTDSIFRHNISSGIQIEYSSGLLANNQVYANSTERETESGNGAGIKVFTNQSVTIKSNTVYDNISAGGRDGGGGIYAFAYEDGKVIVENNIVRNNRSDRKGGGIFAYEALVKGNTITENGSDMTGGGIYALQSVVEDNVIIGNRSEEGGGVFSNDSEMIHNLVRKNQASKGSGVFHLGMGKIEKNSFVENTGDGTAPDAAILMLGNATLRHNNIVPSQGYALYFQSHTLSPDLDARENYWGTDNEKIIEFGIYDWMEDSRVGLVDWKMFASAPFADAYPLPQDASPTYSPELEQAVSGNVRGVIEADTIWGGDSISKYNVVGNLLVREGKTLTIAPNTSLTIQKDVSIRIRGRLMAMGEEGKPVTFTGNPDARWNQIIFESRSLDKASRALSDEETNSMSYCIIENGNGVSMDGKGADLLNCKIQNNKGSGVRIKEAFATVKGCNIQNNTSDSDGGGIYAYGSLPVIIHGNVIQFNRAKDGGGIFAYGYQSNVAVDMRNNLIEGNTSQGDGGGIWASRAAVVDNTIMGNHTENKGGGLYASFALVNGNRITDNAALEGGGIFGESNSTFVGNRIMKNTSLAGIGGGASLNYWGLSKHNKVFSNNLIEQNKTPDGKGTGGICVQGEMDFSRNAIFNNTGLQLNNLTDLSTGSIKAKECFWGSTDQIRIEAMIHDGKDDPSISMVEFEPIGKTVDVTREIDKSAVTEP